ncbi:YgaP family membrane protein [Kaarinaea lacus]
MNTQTLIFDTKTNVGTVDRYVRFTTGAGLIAIPLFYSGVDAEYAALTSLVAIPIIFTAIARWCPVYALLHVHSIRRKLSNAEFYDQNVSVSDAVTRYLLGTVLIMATMMFTNVADPWLVVLALIAVPIIQSAIMLWDPMYALFDIRTYKSRVAYAGGGAEVVALHVKANDTKPTQPSGNNIKAA